MKEVFSAIPKEEDFDFWLQNDLNVLLVGRHGVGKTSMIIDAFKRNNFNYKYFSAATMDPWVDFIGVPKELKDEKGSYLELIRPKDFRDDAVHAIFLDEYNRSHKKVRNAVMELMQFKSINGYEFPNLRVVWAAINPEEDEDESYDVETVDQAQKDRFHIHVEIPYKVSVDYFRSKYGKDKGEAACEWWNGLPKSQKLAVSPRRLDVAMSVNFRGGNIRHVLPPSSGLDKLNHLLRYGSPEKEFNKLIKKNNNEELKKFLANENNFSAVENLVKDNIYKCIDSLEPEKATKIILSNENIFNGILKNAKNHISILEGIEKSLMVTTPKKKADKNKINDKLIKIESALDKVKPNREKHTPDIWQYIKRAKDAETIWRNRNNLTNCYMSNVITATTIQNRYLRKRKTCKFCKYPNLEQCKRAILNEETNNRKSYGTYFRLGIIGSAIDCIENKEGAININDAIDFLDIAEWIIGRAQSYDTFKRHGLSSNFSKAINVCTVIVMKNVRSTPHGFPKDPDSLANKYVNIFFRYIRFWNRKTSSKENSWAVYFA